VVGVNTRPAYLEQGRSELRDELTVALIAELEAASDRRGLPGSAHSRHPSPPPAALERGLAYAHAVIHCGER
jgi:hypothetical protein